MLFIAMSSQFVHGVNQYKILFGVTIFLIGVIISIYSPLILYGTGEFCLQ